MPQAMPSPHAANTPILASWGDTSPIEAELFVRSCAPGTTLLSGTISGPYCEGIQTLPADLRLQLRERAGEQVLTAIVPDPCFWAPDRPYLYRAEVQVATGEEKEIKSESLLLGIRSLAVQRENIMCGGRRHVMRIIDLPQNFESPHDQETLLETCRATGSALLLREFRETLCERASQKGVFLVLQCQGQLMQEGGFPFTRLACWPAIGMVVFAKDLDPAELQESTADSLLRAVVIDARDTEPPPWAQVLFLDEALLLQDPSADRSVPRMVFCRIPSGTSPRDARRACDDLQRRTTEYPQMAGYIASASGALY